MIWIASLMTPAVPRIMLKLSPKSFISNLVCQRRTSPALAATAA